MSQMIPKSESQYIEFKLESINAADLADEMVAFANGEGGEIWLGIDDDGNIAGISHSVEADVMNICRNNCIPPIRPQYDEFQDSEKVVARITIPKGPDRPYYTSRHRYYIRVGTTKRIASREELVRLFQSAGLFHYDSVEVQTAGISDINLSDVSDYFARYEFGFREENDQEKTRLMQAAEILGVGGHPTVVGLLVFGVCPEKVLPQAGIQFAHFHGTEPDAELLDKKFIGGRLPAQVDNALAALKANLANASDIRGAQRIDVPHFPDKVFRELLVNACVHRNYSISGGQIRVFLFKNRFEITSPGRLPNTVNVEKLTVGTSFARNPHLVRFMENLGYVDRLGRGLPMVAREARRLGCDLQFEELGEEFRVCLHLPGLRD